MNKSFLFRFISLATLIFSPLLWRGSGGKALAQNPEANRANIWYFGNGAGLDFSSGSPVAITNGQMIAGEACSSISDTFGNLLFYTDGDTVWDRNHNVMPNGVGIMGCESSSHGVIITPHPTSTNLFYVFSTDCENFFGTGLRYNLIDLSLNGGNGDVVISQKNILLTNSVIECLSSTKICDTVWLMSHKYNTNEFLFYKITSQGLNTTPTTFNVGSLPYYVSSAKFSPSGSKIALVSGFSSPPFIELYDFSSGLLFNQLSLKSFGSEYGVEFSPDESKLYVSVNGNMIFQFDISSNNQALINSSQTLIYDSFDNSSFFSIQNSNNQKIYVSSALSPFLSEISAPNNLTAVNFNYYNIFLNGRLSNLGLPIFCTNYFSENSLIECKNDELIIPNVFSPNGDGINDLFSIAGLQAGDEIAIYNRWGTKVYEFVNTEDTWDGRTADGEKCSTGVYYYYVTRKNTRLLSEENKKGFIHLLY